jgi:hypothetical protein
VRKKFFENQLSGLKRKCSVCLDRLDEARRKQKQEGNGRDKETVTKGK